MAASGTVDGMKFAPRISPRVRSEIEQLAETQMSAAEITRAVGDRAELLGLRRPSYEQVRKLVVEHRSRPRHPSTTDVLLDVAFRVRPPEAVIEHLAGLDLPVRRK
jgi:hypothetical protein